MAKKGVNITFRGGGKLDRALAKMAVTHQSKASKVVTQSLSAGTTQVKRQLQEDTPEFYKDSVISGKKRSKIKVSKGQLKKSIKSGLRNKVNVPRDVFVSGVWFQTKFGGAKEGVDDGFFVKFVDEKHKANAFGFTGGTNFIQKSVKKSESKFKNKLGGQMAKKIAILSQKIINNSV